MKQYFIKYAFNLIMFALGVAIILLLLNRGPSIQNHIDVKVSLAKKPETRTYNFTNPTVYKEKTIEYNTTHVLTYDDTNRIVIDYLKNRIYIDSIVTDTAKIHYTAEVEKNSLKKIKITYSYKPIIIRETTTRTRQALLVGLTPGWIGNTPTIGFFAGFETKQYSFGLQYDPIKNPKGGYIVINKRIFFRK